jgi:signal transduction histidine kinase
VVAFQAHRFDAGAGRPSVLLVGRLLTEQKRLQAQLMHRERLAMVGMMTAGIAHDLGSPLASMSAQIQRLDGGPGSPPIGDVLRDVRHEIERLSRTVRELVDFTRRQKDDAALVSVGSVAEEALRVLRHDPRARLVEFGLVVDPTTPAVDIVADHLTQVLLNLLVNAIDAMPDGGSVRVAVGPAGDKVRLTVADTGTGMSPEVLSRVFEPFFTTKQPGSGAGLGLGLSRDILAGFGATIVLESAPGRGTTAVIDIPVAATAPASPTGAEG